MSSDIRSVSDRNILLTTGQNPLGLHQFPRSKSVTSWRGQKSVVSVVSCHFPNSITTTCCQQVGNKLATSPSTGKLRENVSNGFWANASERVLMTSQYLMTCLSYNIRCGLINFFSSTRYVPMHTVLTV